MTATAQKYVPPRLDSASEAQKVWDALGGVLEHYKIMHNQILVATFSPEKVGSIYRPHQSKKEDQWQGKVGLVLKKGPMAFVDDEATKFHGQNVKLGQWIVYRASDGYEIHLAPQGWNGEKIPCRVLEEGHIKAIIDYPDIVW